MRLRTSLLILALVAAILVAARARNDGVTDAMLQVRVRPGAVATGPPELAAQMAAWPPLSPPDPAEVELGRLLFFDPILSSTNRLSCASCHHPDQGFADALGQAVGVSGVSLPRSAPTLWNVGFRRTLTWDGRARSLDSQMLEGPLFHPDEMAEDPVALLAELQAAPGYRERFEAIYGEVTLANMAQALAAFEQTLLSQNSPFDRYAAGDFYALTGSQRRGFEVFRGPETNCIRCHELPTFASNEFKVIGVRDDLLDFDPGRGGITGREEEMGAFAVPTLRNVALTAPYMHNGVEPALNDAISFYLNGGGDNPNVPRSRLDPDLRAFDLSTRELRDLEAFLLSLTDESGLPATPAALPSGLAPPEPRPNPARQRVAAASALPPGSPRTHEVEPGQSIQAAIDRARPGDTILLAPGDYAETLNIDVADLTLRGDGATLVGRPFTGTGVLIRNHGTRLVGLAIRGFRDFTLDVQGAEGVTLENVTLNGVTVSGPVTELQR